MKIGILTIAIAVLSMFLSACNNDESTSSATSQLILEAEISDGSVTRATPTNFEEGDSIGVFVDSGSSTGENVKYVTTDGSRFAAADGVTPICYNDSKEMILSAYYPYSKSVTANIRTISVDATDQSKSRGFDYLFATTKCKLGKAVKMTFSHSMTKITLTITAGTGISDLKSSATKYCVSGLLAKGEFDTYTGTAKATGSTSATYSDEFAADLETKSVTLIIPPQTPNGDVVVELTYNNRNFSARLGIPSGGFAAGYNYDYSIAITAAGLSVTNYTLSDWTTETSDDELTSSYEYKSNPCLRSDVSQVEKYDYAMADGTFMRNDAPSEIVSIYAKAGEIAGIVYWVKSESSTATFDYDVALKNSQYSNCTHGLIAAVKNVSGYIKGQSSNVSVYEDFQLKSDTYKNYAPIVWQMTDDTTGETIPCYKYLIGYSNTEILRAYNQAGSDKSYIVETLDNAISAGTLKNISGCTPWYVPSFREVILMYTESDFTLATDVSVSFSSTDGDKLNNYLKAANNGNAVSCYYMWVSTEYSYNQLIYIYNRNWNYCNAINTPKTTDSNILRAVCAF